MHSLEETKMRLEIERIRQQIGHANLTIMLQAVAITTGVFAAAFAVVKFLLSGEPK